MNEYEVTAEVSRTFKAESEEDAKRKAESYFYGRFEDDAANKDFDYKGILEVEDGT